MQLALYVFYSVMNFLAEVIQIYTKLLIYDWDSGGAMK